MTFIVFQNLDASLLTARNLGGYASDGSVAPGQTIDGTSDVDRLSGTMSADLIRGADGNDILFGGGGNDVIEGGSGRD
ncbi:hypothetical protein OVW21_27020, partial [Klebsiella pneumoniae]|nr:hypothetical protein [Klebsiella pneumoniae]